jgi:hypothetical protein
MTKEKKNCSLIGWVKDGKNGNKKEKSTACFADEEKFVKKNVKYFKSWQDKKNLKLIFNNVHL